MVQLRTFQNGVPAERHLHWEGRRNVRDPGPAGRGWAGDPVGIGRDRAGLVALLLDLVGSRQQTSPIRRLRTVGDRLLDP
jgi:hypothetical protein